MAGSFFILRIVRFDRLSAQFYSVVEKLKMSSQRYHFNFTIPSHSSYKLRPF